MEWEGSILLEYNNNCLVVNVSQLCNIVIYYFMYKKLIYKLPKLGTKGMQIFNKKTCRRVESTIYSSALR